MVRTILGLLCVVLLGGCEVHHCCPDGDDCDYDHTPPQVPSGVRSVTGDGSVRLEWIPSRDPDVVGYGVYWNDEPYGYYERLGTTSSPGFTVWGLANGRTYYFAVDAYDRCGNSSDLSYEVVWDTPRPAGYGLRLWERQRFPEEAGVDFSRYPGGNARMVVPWDDEWADIYLERQGDRLFITAAAMDTDLLAWGRVSSLDEVDVAPERGWVAGGSMVVAQSHAYLVWTWDNHFAKVLVTRVGPDNLTLDWAYQVDQGNPQLVPGRAGSRVAKAWQGARGARR